MYLPANLFELEDEILVYAVFSSKNSCLIRTSNMAVMNESWNPILNGAR